VTFSLLRLLLPVTRLEFLDVSAGSVSVPSCKETSTGCTESSLSRTADFSNLHEDGGLSDDCSAVVVQQTVNEEGGDDMSIRSLPSTDSAFGSSLTEVEELLSRSVSEIASKFPRSTLECLFAFT
jgi:hypothetical protein